MEQEKKYVSFWIKDLQKKLVVEHTCDPRSLNNVCINDKPEAPFDITPVYFRREVLSKYYNTPHKYCVSDGQISFIDEGFSMHVDTDMRDYVAVILVDLAFLDYNEQCYWRSYNLIPDENTTISKAAYKRWFEGDFAEPIAPDAILRQKYIEFYSEWESLFGWHFFTEDPKNKKSVLYSLHMLSDENNEREFNEQVLNVTKLFIDSLNVKQFPKLEENENSKGLKRLDAYFQQNKICAPGYVEYLRNIQSLRSKGIAHPGSINKKVSDYFGLGTKSYGYIIGSIFATLVKVLNDFMAIGNIIANRNEI